VENLCGGYWLGQANGTGSGELWHIGIGAYSSSQAGAD
tara:strand:- start:2557 stop:2670 length:114 start_codon:yes stop_codon:yes gene_type:complete